MLFAFGQRSYIRFAYRFNFKFRFQHSFYLLSSLHYKRCKQDIPLTQSHKFPTNLQLFPVCSLRLRIHCKLNFSNIIVHFRSQNHTFLCRNQTFACNNPTFTHISVHKFQLVFTLYILNLAAAISKRVNSRYFNGGLRLLSQVNGKQNADKIKNNPMLKSIRFNYYADEREKGRFAKRFSGERPFRSAFQSLRFC